MNELVSHVETTSYTGDMVKHFDYFSQFHQLIVIKEPQKIITVINDNNVYAGYDGSSDNQNITYTQLSGVFNCTTIDPKVYVDNVLEEIPVILMKGDKVIKVRYDAKTYIENGKTVEMILDQESFRLNSLKGITKNYLGLMYYYFSLAKSV